MEQVGKEWEKWKESKLVKRLGSADKAMTRLQEVPLTDYSDYPALHEFGAKIESLSKVVPRPKHQLLWDYYEQLSKGIVDTLYGWMSDEYSFACKTTGSSGKNKWVAHGKT